MDLRIFRLWAAAAWADDQIHPAEAAALKRWLDAAQDITPQEREEAARMMTTRPQVDLAEVQKLPPVAREGVYRAAIAIVAVDGKIVDAERGFLERLRGLLNLDDATMKRLLRSQGRG